MLTSLQMKKYWCPAGIKSIFERSKTKPPRMKSARIKEIHIIHVVKIWTHPPSSLASFLADTQLRQEKFSNELL
jgi:hypothetical protein